MTKKSNLIITSLIVGSISLAGFAPSAYGFGLGSQGQNSDKMGQQMQQMFNQMHQRSHKQAQNKRGKRGSPAGFISVVCDENAAEKIGARFERIGKALNLNSEQEVLLANLKTASLNAQTDFLKVCVKPKSDSELNIVEKIKTKNTDMIAVATASNSVLPELEAFLNSLSDEQKAKLKKGKRGGPNRAPIKND